MGQREVLTVHAFFRPVMFLFVKPSLSFNFPLTEAELL